MSMIRRIPMEGVANFRDLGGYACTGGFTRWNQIYRSTSLHKATPRDVEQLQQLGIRLVLDFRYPHEAKTDIDATIPGARNLNFSLMGDFPADNIPVNSTVRSTRSLYRMYRLILRHGGASILDAFRAVLACDGAVLFHCAAGKDRTGVFAMLLLALAGVDWADIYADYEISELYISNFTTDISGSNLHNMQMLRQTLEQNYGSAWGYLLAQGAREEELEAFRTRFVASEHAFSLCKTPKNYR